MCCIDETMETAATQNSLGKGVGHSIERNYGDDFIIWVCHLYSTFGIDVSKGMCEDNKQFEEVE